MSQSIIRLKKVKVSPKHQNSIIKTSVLRKQLSVHFEDQKPIDAIKCLSQDIDLISSAIDSYFPLKSSKPCNSILSTSGESSIFPNISRKEFPLNSIYFRSFDQKSQLANNGMIYRNLRSNFQPEIPEDIENNILSIKKHKNPIKPSEIDLKIIKKGRNFNPPTTSLHTTQAFHVTESLDSDLRSPKIVKQSKPLIKFSKPKRKPIKDINIDT
jgi:hypothetical protein